MTTSNLEWRFDNRRGGYLRAESARTGFTYVLAQTEQGFALDRLRIVDGKAQKGSATADYTSMGHALFAAEYFEETADPVS
jgi:hypothetical protein